ncbi:hypothetical protein [Aquipluma nitroreducens]|nr:hypothetical protein [Aquipluma nitroreducens]
MNKTELKLKIIQLSKQHRTNEIYDYLIAKYLSSDQTPKKFSILNMQEFLGFKIKNIVLMNGLLYYWVKVLTPEARLDKMRNLINLFEIFSEKERYEITQQFREDDEFDSEFYDNLNDEWGDAA